MLVRTEPIENTQAARDSFNNASRSSGYASEELVLTSEHLRTLHQGQCLAVDDGEYSIFITLEQDNDAGVLTRERAEAECRRYFNQVGLFGGTEPCRIIGFMDDGEDFYYIALTWPRSKGPEKRYLSMVGGFDPVLGEYTRRLWDSMVPAAEDFEIKLTREAG